MTPDFDAVVVDYMKHNADAYRAGALAVDDLRSLMLRANAMRRVISERSSVKARMMRFKLALADFVDARTILREGGVIVSADVGFPPMLRHAPAEELGICRRSPDGHLSTITYRCHERAVRLSKAAHGPIVYVDRGKLPELARRSIFDADIVVFHSACEDRRKLDFTGRPYLDVQRIRLALTGVLHDLEMLCAVYLPISAIDHHYHESGNDAWATMQVFLGMARRHDQSLDDLIRAGRKAHYRRFIKPLLARRENGKKPGTLARSGLLWDA